VRPRARLHPLRLGRLVGLPGQLGQLCAVLHLGRGNEDALAQGLRDLQLDERPGAVHPLGHGLEVDGVQVQKQLGGVDGAFFLEKGQQLELLRDLAGQVGHHVERQGVGVLGQLDF